MPASATIPQSFCEYRLDFCRHILPEEAPADIPIMGWQSLAQRTRPRCRNNVGFGSKADMTL
jgi:hypothetical protein